MAYFIYARDGAGLLILKRPTQEAAEKKASELDDMGCFEVEIGEGPTPRQPNGPVTSPRWPLFAAELYRYSHVLSIT